MISALIFPITCDTLKLKLYADTNKRKYSLDVTRLPDLYIYNTCIGYNILIFYTLPKVYFKLVHDFKIQQTTDKLFITFWQKHISHCGQKKSYGKKPRSGPYETHIAWTVAQ